MQTKSYVLLVFLFAVTTVAAFSQNGTTLHSLPSGYTNTQLRWKNCIASDNSGNIYIGFIFIGMGKYNIASASWSMLDTLNSGLPDNNVRALEFDAVGNMWIGTTKGLAKFDGNNWQVYDSLNSGLVTNNISSLKTTSAGLWCGTSKGLHFFDGISWTLFNNTNSGLVNDTVLCMDADNMNNIYIGTQGGLSHFNGSIWSNYTKYNSALVVNKITNVKCTSANTVWLFNTSLYRLTNGTILDDRCQYKTPDEDSYFKGILGLAVDTNDRAWFLRMHLLLCEWIQSVI